MASLQTWKVEEPFLNLHCALGEGPYYEKGTNSLRFLDIINKRIHTVSLTHGPGSWTTIQLDSPVGVTADIEGVDPEDKLLVALKYGLAVLDRKSGKYEYLEKGNFGEAKNDRLRSNDGAVDSNGRLWLGTMTDFGLDLEAEGSLFRFDNTGREEFLKDLKIPNSIGWSPDNKTLYFTHSTAQTVFAFDYSPEDSSVSNQRVHYHHEGTGDPDGFRVDTEGNIWHAVYGEGRVLKISPEGKLVGEILLPTKNITCTEFVGTELFITTAGMGADDGDAAQRELSGALFRVDVGVEGLKPFEFKLKA